MNTVRIIPRLDIKGPNVVKGIHLEGLRVLGKPSQFAQYYYEQGADELMFMDVVASLYDRNSLAEIISETAKRMFIPLTVGGGLRTIEDISSVLRAGADKVSLNTAAIKNPNFVKEAALKFGSSTIVVSIEAIKQPNGEYLAFTDNGREYTGIEVVSWAQKVQELGAGEIVVTSVDHEGTGLGFDEQLIEMIESNTSIPIVAHGGAGKVEDVCSVIKKTAVDGVCIASMLHYDFVKKSKVEFNPDVEGNRDFLQSGQAVKKVQTVDIVELKHYLRENNINVREI